MISQPQFESGILSWLVTFPSATFRTAESTDRGSVLKVEEGVNSWIAAIVPLFSTSTCTTRNKKAQRLLPQ